MFLNYVCTWKIIVFPVQGQDMFAKYLTDMAASYVSAKYAAWYAFEITRPTDKFDVIFTVKSKMPIDVKPELWVLFNEKFRFLEGRISICIRVSYTMWVFV